MTLEQRQSFDGSEKDTMNFLDDNGNEEATTRDDFWFSTKAEIIKWAIVAGVFLIFFIWFVAGYYHAKRRVKKGLKPLPYHRFLVPRAQRAKSKPQNNLSFYRREDQGYRMESYAPPPPVYDPNLAAPPGYNGPPQGSSKADSSQEWIAPPPGAPPGHSVTSDVEQGMPSHPVKAEPAKGGMFQKFRPRIPKINLLGK